MDSFYKTDQVKSGCAALDKLIKYRRPKDLAIDKFFIEMNLMMNKVETLDVKIPDAFKAYLLLECANLSQNKKEICRATCAKLTCKDMRGQIEKVGYDAESTSSSTSNEHNTKTEFSVIKTEPATETLYVQSCLHCGTDTALSSDDEVNQNDTFYTSKSKFQRPFSNNRSHNSKQNQYNNSPYNNNDSRNRPSPNPLNKFGHYTTCDYCKSIFHYLPSCPDCPQDIKLQYSSKKQMRYGGNNNNTY